MSLNIVNSFKITPPPPGIIGGWKELGRTTLGAPGDDLTVAGLTDKRYYMVLCQSLASGKIVGRLRLNGDTGANYAYRASDDGGTDFTAGPDTAGLFETGGSTTPKFTQGYFANLATKEKLNMIFAVVQNSAGAATAPGRRESVNKHAQTTNPITSIGNINTGGGSFDTGSEIVVLEWDPTDTHTDNFWEELASVDLSGGAANLIDSGTFAAKKYLWVQLFVETITGVVSQRLTLNSDTGTNYSSRRSKDGGTDETNINTTSMERFGDDVPASSGILSNIFIINNLANEKLANMQTVWQNAAGAGTVPTREIGCWKWANTSEQITKMTFTNNKAGSMGPNTILKVWGSD